MKNVLITGGTGLIGRTLKRKLSDENYNVRILSRKNISAKDGFNWDPENKIIDTEAIDFADIIIHLAGENISTKRWTKEQKEKIVKSRVESAQLLKNAIENSEKKLEKFISASAIGYYGTFTSEKIFIETDKPGNDFLAETVNKWEDSVMQFNEYGIKTVIFRIGVVMSPEGGALAKMIKPVKRFASFPVGSGKQYVPWIALTDLVKLFTFAVKNKPFEGIYNAVNPEHFTNVEIMKDLAKIYNKPFIPIGIPAFMLKLIYGKMSGLLLKGSRVSAEKILKTGFQFETNSLYDLNLK